MTEDDLKKIVLGVTNRDAIFLGVHKRGGYKWKAVLDITNDFTQAVIIRWKGLNEIVQDKDGAKYEISIKPLNQ